MERANDPVQPREWREFFDSHAPHYDQNPFTRNTKVEVQFLWDAIKLQPGMALLDIGCGTGRHAIELAARGIKVTGLDISSGMLHEAQKKARAAQVEIEWIHDDATKWSRSGAFDAAVCLCEGGFGLINHEEDAVAHDLGILKCAAESLKPGSPFVLTALNAYAIIRRATEENVENGSFNPATMEMFYADEWQLPEGPTTMYLRERLFIPPEIAAMMHFAGLTVEHVWGGTAGDWGERPLKMDEIEVMMVARKR